ncbi:MAG: GntR family transcriptional regulator [Pseudonocardiaceae bacterium]
MTSSARRNVDHRQPKYLRIYHDLAARIASRDWPPQTPLPPQRELADEYGVTIMTLRQALQLLAHDGLIDTRHGSGTYVAPPRYDYDLGNLRSFAQDLAGQGAQVTTRVLAADVVTAPAATAARLGGGTEALLLRRLRLVDGRPLVWQASYLPTRLANRLDPAGLESRPLYAVLADQGVHVGRASETIRPTTLEPADADLLDRAAGAPALLSHRISYTTDDQPIIDDHALLPGDSVSITADRGPDSLQFSYTLRGSATPG